MEHESNPVVWQAHSVGSDSSCAAVLFSERSRSAHPASTGTNSVAFADASSSLPAQHAETLRKTAQKTRHAPLLQQETLSVSWPLHRRLSTAPFIPGFPRLLSWPWRLAHRSALDWQC